MGAAVIIIRHGAQHHQGLLQDDVAVPRTGETGCCPATATTVISAAAVAGFPAVVCPAICAHVNVRAGLRTLYMPPCMLTLVRVRCCVFLLLSLLLAQVGKLVPEADAKAEVLQQLEAAFKQAPAPGGGDSKGAKKAAK